jgi:2-succinyl-6-hydroxy-2,4-cyclohexadiene-1-carboxylate synthase
VHTSRSAAVRIETDDGVALAVERLGDGPLFVMVHGFTGARDDFADHAPRFAERATVVTFDHRGHGESEKPAAVEAYTFDRLVADTLAVADALDFGRFTLLGHSMGGMVARRLVLAHPERVSSLILMDTSPGLPESIDPELADAAADLALEGDMHLLRQILDEADTLGSEADQRVRRERPGYEEFCARKWSEIAPASYAGLLREIVHQPDELDAMHAITCPTLVIVGEEDVHFVPAARAMAGAVRDARLVVVPDAGHSPQFENPDAFFAAVDEFLATHLVAHRTSGSE